MASYRSCSQSCRDGRRRHSCAIGWTLRPQEPCRSAGRRSCPAHIRAVIEPLGDLVERQNRDSFEGAHPLRPLVIEETEEAGGEEEIGVRIPRELLAMSLRNANPDWKEGLSDRPADALKANALLLVCFGSTSYTRGCCSSSCPSEAATKFQVSMVEAHVLVSLDVFRIEGHETFFARCIHWATVLAPRLPLAGRFCPQRILRSPQWAERLDPRTTG